MRVVEIAGDFLAIARDKRHRCAFVEQRDCRRDLVGIDAEFPGDQLNNFYLCDRRNRRSH